MDIAGEISGIEPLLKEGEAFFRVVQRSPLRPGVFNPELVHGLLSMALEKFAMCILMSAGTMPDNHTFGDLVGELKAHIPVSAEIEAALLELDVESDLCSLEIRKTRIPGEERMRMLIGIGERLQAAARECVREGNHFPLQLE
jgi:hypothetical protein